MLKSILRFLHRRTKFGFVLAMDFLGVLATLRDVIVGVPLIFEGFLYRLLPSWEAAYRFTARFRFRIPRFGLKRGRNSFMESKFIYRSNLAIFVDTMFMRDKEGELVFKRQPDTKLISIVAAMKNAGYFEARAARNPIIHLMIASQIAEKYHISHEEVVASLCAITEEAIGPRYYLGKTELAKFSVRLMVGEPS